MQVCLLGTNGFDAKAKNERFTAAGSRCVQNLKNENISRPRLSDFVKEISPKSVQHNYFSSFNQSHDRI